jgi:branched-chain amino acid transport system substrate-binding protein
MRLGSRERIMKRLIVAVTAVLLFAGTSVLVSPGVADEVEVVQVEGFAAPSTGPSAYNGNERENSARLAIEGTNWRSPMLANRPFKFELVAQADQGDLRIASPIAQRLSDMSVAGVVGHFNSSCSIAASNVCESASVAEVSPSSTSPAYTCRRYKTAFRVIGQDGVAGAVLGRYVVETPHVQRIAIIVDRTAFGQCLADTGNDAIGSLHGQVVGREYITDKTVDFSAVLMKVRSQNADFVVFHGFDAQTAQPIRRMRSLQMNAKLVGEAFNNDAFLKLARGDGEGKVTIQPGLPMDKFPANGSSRQYGGSFKEKLEGSQGPYGYDAATVLVHAVLESQSSAPVRYWRQFGELSDAPYTVFRLDGNAWSVLKIIAGK